MISSDTPIHREDEYEVNEFKYIGIPDFEKNRLDYPLSINLELTMRCYTDCCYCYADRSSKIDDTLSTKRILELIREARRHKVINFDINGGEVLLHPDIKIILKELKDNGFKPLVSTKIPIGKEMLDFFSEIKLDKFQISLDSIEEDVLSKTLRTPKGYIEKISDTLKYASIIGLQVDINTVLTKYNAGLEEIEALLKYTSSFSCVRNHRLNAAGYSLYKRNFERIKTDVNTLTLIESNIPFWKNQFDININMSYYECASQFTLPEKLNIFPSRAICTGNIWNMVILPNGDVTICEELYHKDNFILGNLKNETIDSVWNGPKAMKLYNYTISSQSKSVCKSCEDFKRCRMGKGVCWKTIIMAYGDKYWDFPDPRCPKAPIPYNRYYY